MKTKKIYALFLIILAFSFIIVKDTIKGIEFSRNDYDDNLNHYISKSKFSTHIMVEKPDTSKDETLIYKTKNKSHNNSKDTMIIALLGSDERGNESSRSDVIILAKYIEKQSKVILVSVPRDSKVNIEGKGMNKINAAFAYGGSALAVKTLENLFDIKVDYYLKVNFNGFIKIVDEIGGVKVVSEKNFYKHWDDNELYIKEGENVLSGEELLEYVRFRKDHDGDFGRIRRQQEVIISAFNSLLHPSNIKKIPKLVKIISTNVETNINWLEIIKIAYDAKMNKNISFETHTLETNSKMESNRWYEIIDQEDLIKLSKLLK